MLKCDVLVGDRQRVVDGLILMKVVVGDLQVGPMHASIAQVFTSQAPSFLTNPFASVARTLWRRLLDGPVAIVRGRRVGSVTLCVGVHLGDYVYVLAVSALTSD